MSGWGSKSTSHRDTQLLLSQLLLSHLLLSHLLLRKLEGIGVRGDIEILHLALQLLELIGQLLLLWNHAHVDVLLMGRGDLLLLLLEHLNLLCQS